MLGLVTALMPFADAGAQQTNEQLAARCAQLGAIFDKYALRRGEGSGGPDMERMGASIDCSKDRYDKGIKTLEDLLKRDRISYPPA
ncbi:MAG: hypothetical protein A3D94_10710 [Alphaproteobacteria bacterium RIFCSPHIGHO2_12_FULL_66_14]|nr:MAG: hypothetical protein A3D94_10710 [Alphaproteobacteria bacterium RIFCSPHIGHO2_12_FULL_66_14]